LKTHTKIALLGNPNAGKSSLFNQLTGLNQKTGNFPGVTVDKLSGLWNIDANTQAEIIDLPGLYSLFPKSADERVVIDILANPIHSDYPDLAIVVADASNLKRNLLLFSQISDLGVPTVLAINMIDVANSQGIDINSLKLSKELGVPVAEINAKKGIGVNGLKLAVQKVLKERPNQHDFSWTNNYGTLFDTVQQRFGLKNNYLAALYVSQTQNLSFLQNPEIEQLKVLGEKAGFDTLKFQSADTIQRYQKIDKWVSSSIDNTTAQNQATSFTEKIDRIALHRVWGYLIFFGILFLMFQAVFTWATIPMDAIDSGVAELNTWLKGVLPTSKLTDLLTDGLLAGIGGVVIFIPQIVFLFAFIALLEETGYMSRVMFLMDKLMRRFGLSGRSVVPLVSGIACAVPAIISTRNIDSWKDRLVTIMVTPLMSCSARLPVYTILIALVVPQQKVLGGIFDLQGLVLLGLYLLGFIAAISFGFVLSKILKIKEKGYFIMEMPSYKAPRFSHILLQIFNSAKTFVLEAGRIIVAISVVLWVLSSYGPGDSMEQAESQVKEAFPTLEGIELENRIASQRLENSYAGHLGKTIEPIIKPLGYDWKIGIALITSFAAREVFIGTMSTIYSLGGSDEASPTIKKRLASEINPQTGKPMYTLALGVSLLLFYVFAMQCMSTLAATYRETKSWKYPIAQLVFMTGLAYLSALSAYQLLS
jgi:ferrous iron transport protein B